MEDPVDAAERLGISSDLAAHLVADKTGKPVVFGTVVSWNFETSSCGWSMFMVHMVYNIHIDMHTHIFVHRCYTGS